MKNLNLFPIKVTTENKNNRSCGECTACCDGHLNGEAYGYAFGDGVKCHFLQNNKCSIYPNHPKQPCKDYECFWLINEDIPDNMRPDKSRVLLTPRDFDKFTYVHAMEIGQKIDSTILAQMIQYFVQNDINLEYQVDGKYYRLGSKDFLVAADEEVNKKISNKL